MLALETHSLLSTLREKHFLEHPDSASTISRQHTWYQAHLEDKPSGPVAQVVRFEAWEVLVPLLLTAGLASTHEKSGFLTSRERPSDQLVW